MTLRLSRPPARDVISICLPIVACILTWITQSVLHEHTWFWFYPSMFFAAWLGSVRASVTAIALSALAEWFFFLDPRNSFRLARPSDLLMIAVFLTLGALFTYSTNRARLADARAAAALSAATRAEDRERIARDLHDTVIQRLFAVTLGVEATLRMSDRAEAQQRARELNDELNRIIATIRTTIFDLRHGRHTDGVRIEVRQLVTETAARVGCAPQLQFFGPVDAAIGELTETELLAVLSEALSNIVRHSRATRFSVVVEVSDGQATLTVKDNGVGIPTGVATGDGCATWWNGRPAWVAGARSTGRPRPGRS